jgi:hypothetical protein
MGPSISPNGTPLVVLCGIELLWYQRVTVAGLQLWGLVGEGGEGVSCEAHDAPLVEDLGSDGLVDGDGGGIPGEDVPLEAGAALFDGDTGEVAKEGFADSLASAGGGYVEIFEADSVMAAPGRVAGKVQGEACGFVVVGFGYDALEAGGGTEAVAEEVGFGGEDGVGLAFIGG